MEIKNRRFGDYLLICHNREKTIHCMCGGWGTHRVDHSLWNAVVDGTSKLWRFRQEIFKRVLILVRKLSAFYIVSFLRHHFHEESRVGRIRYEENAQVDPGYIPRCNEDPRLVQVIAKVYPPIDIEVSKSGIAIEPQ
jgi:hypothetical protein